MGGISLGSLGDRPVFFPAVFLLVGAALGPTELTASVALALAVVLSGCAIVFHRRVGSHLALLAGCALFGTGLATLHSGVVVPEGTFAPGKSRLWGRVEDVRPAEGGSSVAMWVHEVGGAPARFGARLFVEGTRPPPKGADVLLRASLRPLHGAANPGEHDRTGQWRRQGLVARGGAQAEALLVSRGGSPAEAWMQERRLALAARAQALAPDAEAAALYLTLAAGLRAKLGDALEEAFAQSGLAHVLSVSGLHVAALALALLASLRRLLVRIPWRALRRVDARRLAAPLSVPLLWGYVAFTGNQAPAVRSALMATLWLLGLAATRRSDALNALSLAAIALFAVDPAALADLSTQLSVTAVLGLILLAPRLREVLPVPLPSPGVAKGARLWLQRAREAAVQSAVASAAAMLATAPIIAAAFHRVGWAGLLANAVCLPLNAAVAVVAALSAALDVAAPAASAPLVWLGTWLSLALVHAARLFAALPAATWAVPAPGAALSALWWAGLLALVFARGRWRAGVLAAPAAAALLVLLPRAQAAPLEVTFLAVGHGDAIFLSSRGEHALVDGGGNPRGGDVGRRVVASFLRDRGVEALALAALTHPHPDHAVGLAEALRLVPARELWLPQGAGQGPLVSAVVRAAAGAEARRVKAGDRHRLGEAELEVLGPPADRVLLESENDRSLVVRVRHGEVTFLLTGDVEEAGEEALEPGSITVLKAPHHGSDTSSTPAFVAKTRPRFVVFCVGKDHRFKFPRPEVVRRWEDAGARCYRTDLDGSVTFRSDGREVTVETFLPRPPAQARQAPRAR